MRINARSPKHVLNTAGAGTQSLLKRARFLQEIQSALLPVLSANGAKHVGVADYSDGRLLLLADSGAWATRLRYQEDLVRRALAQQLRLDLSQLEVKVRPAVVHFDQPRPRPDRRLPDTARAQLAQTAGYVDDAGLAQALVRLSTCEPGSKTRRPD